MRRLLEILGKALVQCLAFAGLALFVVAAVKLSGFADRVGSPFSAKQKDTPEELSEPEPVDNRQLVIIDPGHGGRDGGTIAGGALEKALNLDTAKRVARHLEAGGVRVAFTREDDSTLELNERARMSNKTPAALFVSIHQNAVAANRAPNGIETYYTYPKPSSVMRAQRALFDAKDGETFVDRRGEELARRIQQAACSATGASDRGIKNRNFVVTRYVSAPAVLIECGFLSNPAENAKLRNESYREKLSQGIAKGLLEYLNERETDPMLGVSFPDRVVTSELADIPVPAGG